MTSERLTEILMDALARDDRRADLADPSADLSRRERDSHALLAHVDHLTAENARLRDGITELVSVGYSHTPDCEANEWQRVAYGGHPDCGLCREDKLATLLNPPTEGETDE